MRYHVTFPDGREIPVDLHELPTGEIRVEVAGRTLSADAVALGAATHLRVGGKSIELWMEGTPPEVGVVAGGRRFYARVESERSRALSMARGPSAAAGAGVVTSPMPGRVLKVLVAEGDVVARGAPLVVVEAMKMENELCAERDGTISRVHVAPGATVEGGARLVEIT